MIALDFRRGRLALAVLLALAASPYPGEAPARERVTLAEFPLYGFRLSDDLPAVRDGHRDLQLSVTVGEEGTVVGVSGYLFPSPADPVRTWSAVLSFTGPAADTGLYGVIIHHEDVSASEVETALHHARARLGAPRVDERSEHTRHDGGNRIRILEWGERGRIYYRLTVDTVQFTGETPVTRLQHILFDVARFNATPLSAGGDRGASGDEGAGDRQQRDQ